MPTISLCGLPVSRTRGWPDNKRPLEFVGSRLPDKSAEEHLQHLMDWDFDSRRPGAVEHYLRGVFAPPMDILEIKGPID